MKKLFVVTAAALSVVTLASCTRTERNISVGAASGAIIGGAVTGRAGGAIAGAVVGGTAGALVSRADRPGRCIYRDRNGRRYEARCR